MAIYWVLFSYFAAGAMLSAPQSSRTPWVGVLFAFGTLLMVVLIGLRYDVGGDWEIYGFMFERIARVDFARAVSIGDPGYQAVNWAAYQLGGDVWLVNAACAVVFVWGLARFCAAQPFPWVTAVVAIPYLVVVVAMGYTRQAVAIGIILAGIAAVTRGGSIPRFAMYIVAAALFHRTAIVTFPLVAIAVGRTRLVNLLVVLALAAALYDAFLGDAMDEYVSGYIQTEYSSQGAAIRIGMCILPAIIFAVRGRRLAFSEVELKLWRNFSFATLFALVMLLVTPSSTAVDRVSLYLLPLQLGVLGRLPYLFKDRLSGVTIVTCYGALVQLVWLNFAEHASLWVPYQFFPMQS